MIFGKKTGCRVRLVESIDVDDEGNDKTSIVCLSPAPNREKHEDQGLDDHVGAVEREAKRVADALDLPKDASLRNALLFAARWHDEGKKADVWQRFVYGATSAQEGASTRYKGKSSKTRDPKMLRGYRHEFGSLLRLKYPEHARCRTAGCDLFDDAETLDLALHLIATHHGSGRPHFEPALYAPFTTRERDELHLEQVRRFARLQRELGWWRLAWLENLLRCADAAASADIDAEDDPIETKGAQQ